jgi:hypothetical protein
MHLLKGSRLMCDLSGATNADKGCQQRPHGAATSVGAIFKDGCYQEDVPFELGSMP